MTSKRGGWWCIAKRKSVASARHERRNTRLRRASKLPPGKTFDTLDEARLPPALVRRLHELADGDFLDDATNVLAFGLPAPATYCYTSLSSENIGCSLLVA